jgi:O-antigen/teichoic acid export membrane protein
MSLNGATFSNSAATCRASSPDFDEVARTKDLGRSAVRGGGVTLAAQLGKAAIQLVSITALSRLLEPGDFGLVAMVAAVIGFVELFRDLGLSMATVQHPDITHDQISTLFWINTAAGLLMALGVAAISPLVAWWYGEPRLTAIAASASVALALGGLTVQHLALLRRRMDFGALARIDLASQGAGVAAAILVACLGGGYWGLVALPVVSATVTALGVLITAHWRPSFRFHAASVRPLLSFGAEMSGCNIFSYLSKVIDNVLIGLRWGPGALGLYSRAYGVLMLPITQINGPISAVAVPVLSRLRHDPAAFSACYLNFLRVLMALTTPACGVMLLYAPEVIRVLLGPRWGEAGPVLRMLSLASIVLPVWYSAGLLFVATGRTKAYLRLWVFLFLGLALAFVLGLPWGIMGVARGYAIGMWLLIVPFLILALKGTAVSPAHLARAIAMPLLACVAGGFVAIGIDARMVGWAGPLPRLFVGSSLIGLAGLSSLGFGPGGFRSLRAALTRKATTQPGTEP